MKKALKLILAGFVIASLAYSVAGCAPAVPAIDDAVVAMSLDNSFKPVNPTDSYPAGATLFSISVKVSSVKPENEVLVKWFDAMGEINTTTYKPDKAGSGYLGFTLELPSGFPAGAYHAEVYLDGKLAKTVEWTVK